MKLEKNQLVEQELFLLWDSVTHRWKRILYFDESGYAVELMLTPIASGLRKRDHWEAIGRMQLSMHRAYTLYGNGPGRRGDQFWRYIMRNKHSVPFNELRGVLMKQLKFETVNQLLYWDFMPQIDWDKYTANASNGFCPFSLCKRLPKR